jgi:RNA polymerase sigma-70 factor (ECF subfamily)
LDEPGLVDAARRKEGLAVRSLIKQHNRRLYRIARSIVRNDADAEDVLQEAYVRAFSSLDGFRGEARFGTWLARIVINEALGCVRRRQPTIDISAVADNPAAAAQIIPFPGASVEADPETNMANPRR